jgi:hypothetical protein
LLFVRWRAFDFAQDDKRGSGMTRGAQDDKRELRMTKKEVHDFSQ